MGDDMRAGDGLAWLGFWICLGLINFQSCSASKMLEASLYMFESKPKVQEGVE